MMDDSVETLTLNFKNTKPVEVIDFLSIVQGVQSQYRKILKEQGLSYSDNLKLYIQVKEGSIEWVFSIIVGKIGDLFTSELLKKAYSKITTTISRVRAGEELIEDIPLLENTQKVLRPIKEDSAGKVYFSYENKDEKLEFYIDGVTAKEIFDKIGEIVEKIKIPTNKEFKKEVMRFNVTKNNVIKAKIDTFHENEVAIICSDEMKDKLIKENEKNPFSTYFVVSGEIKTIDNKIIAYHIIDLDDIISQGMESSV